MPNHQACKATSSKLSDTCEMSKGLGEWGDHQIYRGILEIRVVNPQVSVNCLFLLCLNKYTLKTR